MTRHGVLVEIYGEGIRESWMIGPQDRRYLNKLIAENCFGDYYTRPLVRDLSNSDYRFGSATHGYLPQKGPQPILLAKGPDIKENTVLSGGHIIHEAPTYAKILGVDLGDTDGHAIVDILK